MDRLSAERAEYDRLMRLFEGLPANKKAVAEGLIQEAARLKARLDDLWADLAEKGEVEVFQQSEKVPAYERERPASKTYTATNKSYQSIMKQLTDLVPAGDLGLDELAEFRR